MNVETQPMEPAATTTAVSRLAGIQAREHPNCVVCAHASPAGLGLKFQVLDDGSVRADVGCSHRLEGYPGILHGGSIALVLDGAMTNCLFAHGIIAVTADLRVRFRHPLLVGTPATVQAWLRCSLGRLHVLRAKIVQDGQTKAAAQGKFMGQPDPFEQADVLPRMPSAMMRDDVDGNR